LHINRFNGCTSPTDIEFAEDAQLNVFYGFNRFVALRALSLPAPVEVLHVRCARDLYCSGERTALRQIRLPGPLEIIDWWPPPVTVPAKFKPNELLPRLFIICDEPAALTTHRRRIHVALAASTRFVPSYVSESPSCRLGSIESMTEKQNDLQANSGNLGKTRENTNAGNSAGIGLFLGIGIQSRTSHSNQTQALA
jgi:hypothetical protein